MSRKLYLAATTALLPLSISIALPDFTQPAIAIPATQPSIKQANPTNIQTTNSYRKNYENAIAKGIIVRPSAVENEDRALNLAYLAIDNSDRKAAAMRFAQALVIISEKDGVTEALAFERRLNNKFQNERGQTLRKYLPVFESIFPNTAPTPATTATPSTPYRVNYEKAIARGAIGRPSAVNDETQAIDLAYQAIDKSDRDEAAIRFAQALVIMSEKDKDGTLKALAFERRLDADILEQRRQTLRAFLPLFGRIFPE